MEAAHEAAQSVLEGIAEDREQLARTEAAQAAGEVPHGVDPAPGHEMQADLVRASAAMRLGLAMLQAGLAVQRAAIEQEQDQDDEDRDGGGSQEAGKPELFQRASALMEVLGKQSMVTQDHALAVARLAAAGDRRLRQLFREYDSRDAGELADAPEGNFLALAVGVLTLAQGVESGGTGSMGA